MQLFGPPNVEKMKASGDIPGLIKALDYKKDPAIRQAAIEALATLGNKSMEPVTAALKKATDQESKDALVSVLGKIGLPAMETLIGLLGDTVTATAAAQALGKIGKSAVDRLLAMLQEPYGSARPRVEAAAALGWVGKDLQDEELRGLIVEGLASAAIYFDNMSSVRPRGWPPGAGFSDPNLESPCFEAIARIGDLHALPLMAAIRWENYRCRNYPAVVFQIIAEQAGSRAIEPILRIIQVNPPVEASVDSRLLTTSFFDTGPKMIAILSSLVEKEPDLQVRNQVVQVLVEALQKGKYLANAVCNQIITTLKKITGQSFSTPDEWIQWWEQHTQPA